MEFNWNKFRELRKENHVSVNHIIKKMNISQSTYWLWEHGKRHPEESNIRALAKIINVPVSLISDLKEEAPVTRMSPGEISSTIIAPILFDGSRVDTAYDNVINVVTQLKRKRMENSVLLKALSNSINVMFYVKDVTLNYIATNELFLKTLSFQPDFVCSGRKDDTFFSEEEARFNSKEDEQVLVSGSPVINREDYIPGTRKKKWGLVSKHPIFDTENKVCGIVGTFIDITERIISEKKRVMLENAIDNLSIGVSISVENDTLLKNSMFYLNKAYGDIIGLEREYILKNPGIRVKLIHPDFTEKVINFVSGTTFPRQIEFKVVRKNDRKETWVQLLQEKIGTFMISFLKDISEEKKNEEVSELLKIHMDAMKSGITIINLETNKYEYMNEAREKIYGRPAKEFYSHHTDFWITDCVHPEDRKVARNIISSEASYRKDHPVVEIRIIRPGGEIRWVKKETSYIKFKGCRCMFHIESDITDLKHEEALKEVFQIGADLLPDAIFFKESGVEDKFLYVNEAVEKIYGYPQDSFYDGGINFWKNKCVSPKSRPLFSNIKSLEKQSEPINFQIIKPDRKAVDMLLLPPIRKTIAGKEYFIFIHRKAGGN